MTCFLLSFFSTSRALAFSSLNLRRSSSVRDRAVRRVGVRRLTDAVPLLKRVSPRGKKLYNKLSLVSTAGRALLALGVFAAADSRIKK